MTYKSEEQRDHMTISVFAEHLAHRLGADKKKKNWIIRNLWQYYERILWWNLPSTHNWMLGSTQKITYMEDHIGFHSVTGFVYLARLLVTYPGFQQYLTKYVREAYDKYEDKARKEEKEDMDGPEETDTSYTSASPAADDSDVDEAGAEAYMPEIYYGLWEQTGDELYLRYLQSLLYVLNRLGKANLNNDGQSLTAVSGNTYEDKYYQNVIAYCLLVIEKFEDPDFKLNRRYELNKHIRLNLGFGKYRDRYLSTLSSIRKLENQTLGLAGFLRSSRHLSRWQITRMTALAQKYQNVLYRMKKKTFNARLYTAAEKRMEILEELERYTQLYARNHAPDAPLTEQEYQKLRSLSDTYRALLAGARKEPDD